MKYTNTKSGRLLRKAGEENIRRIWEKRGYQKTAEYFDSTVAVIRSIVKDKQWKRPAVYTPNLLKSVRNGTKTTGDFPSLSFDPDTLDGNVISNHLFFDENIEITVTPTINNNNTENKNDKYTLHILVNTNKINH